MHVLFVPFPHPSLFLRIPPSLSRPSLPPVLLPSPSLFPTLSLTAQLSPLPQPPTVPPQRNLTVDLRRVISGLDIGVTFESSGGISVMLSVTGASEVDIMLLVSPLSFEEYSERCNRSLPPQILMQSQGLERASESKIHY